MKLAGWAVKFARVGQIATSRKEKFKDPLASLNIDNTLALHPKSRESDAKTMEPVVILSGRSVRFKKINW